MTDPIYKLVIQRDFFSYVETYSPPVHYEYPGIFKAGSSQVNVRLERVGGFLARIEKVMSFDDYDKLARDVWVAHMNAEDKTKSWARR